MSDQHPVQWLVESLTLEVYAPMHDWLEQVMENNDCITLTLLYHLYSTTLLL